MPFTEVMIVVMVMLMVMVVAMLVVMVVVMLVVMVISLSEPVCQEQTDEIKVAVSNIGCTQQYVLRIGMWCEGDR